MVARFRQMSQRPAIDRQEMLRRALAAAQSRRQSVAPTRGGSPVADRVGGMHGAQGAIDFGRAQTANPGVQQAIDAIRSRVGQGLSNHGIYQDDRGAWQIQGLDRPVDNGIAIRNAAVQGMGGQQWMDLVNHADARLRSDDYGATRGALPGGLAPNGPGAGISAPASVRPGAVTPAAPTPAPRGVVPQPGLGGVPQARPITPAPAGNVTPFPPQGQGVGRTTTPTGNQVNPGQYPITAPQPGLGGVPSIPAGGNLVGTPRSAAATPSTMTNPNDRIGISAPTQQSIDNGAFRPYASPGMPVGGNQVIDPNASQQGRIGGGTGGQIIGSGIGARPANSATVTTPGQVSPRTGIPSPGLGGVPQAAGRPATPTVAPGALPGNTTPSRPGQMPSTFPNGNVFGSAGNAAPLPGMSAIKDLSGLGEQIAGDVQSRIAGIRAQTPLASQQQTGMDSLQGLGDRIRASVQRATAGTSSVPGVGTSDLGGGLGSDIMGRVQAQLAQQGVGQVGTLGQAGTGQGTTPGGPAPGAPTTAAPTGSTAMPTGTGSLGQMGGRYQSLDQYNSVFESAGQEFGVPPELLKAMAGVESGWGSVGPDYCRSDGSCGIMQVKGDIWNGTAGCSNQNDVVCNVRTAAAILSQAKAQCGNWDCAITGTYFPTDDVQNGTTQGQYLDAVHQSMQEQIGNPGTGQPAPTGGTQVLPTNASAPQQAPIPGSIVTDAGLGGVTPGAPPAGGGIPGAADVVAGPAPSGPGGGVYNTIAQPAGQASNGQPTSTIDAGSTAWADALTPGGSQAVQSGGYGFDADQGLDIYGGYNQQTWPCHTCHPGVDVATNGSQPYNALTSGTVTCVGSQSGLSSGGAVPDGSVGCGAYGDSGGGPGNVSVLKDDGALIVYGHSRSSNYQPGQTVQAGQPLGMSGENNGYHIHEEVQLPIGPGGQYAPVDPDLYYSGYYCGQGFCPS